MWGGGMPRDSECRLNIFFDLKNWKPQKGFKLMTKTSFFYLTQINGLLS